MDGFYISSLNCCSSLKMLSVSFPLIVVPANNLSRIASDKLLFEYISLSSINYYWMISVLEVFSTCEEASRFVVSVTSIFMSVLDNC